LRYGLAATLAAQGVSGLAGGYGLVADPSGEAVGLPLAWLGQTPFSDYFVPGLILLTVLGVFPLIVAWSLWRRRPWARRGALVVGAALLIWIVVEIVMIGYHPWPPLQAAYGLLSLLILSLASSREIKRSRF